MFRARRNNLALSLIAAPILDTGSKLATATARALKRGFPLQMTSAR
jgi:hypothetical protein